MQVPLIILTLVFGAFLITDSSAQVNKFDSLILQEHNANRFDGTIVIGSKDRILYSKAIGTASRVWNISMELNHQFDIASLAKAFIAAMVLMNVEQGVMMLDDKIVKHLPAFKSKYADDITIHQLLIHTAGLSDYAQMFDELTNDNYRKAKRLHFDDTSDYINFISSLQPINEPGKAFYYSNFGYHLLALMLEKIEEKPFSDLLEQRITNRLGLSNTYSPERNTKVYENTVEAYNWKNGVYERNQFIDFTFGRRIYSTSEDLYQWAVALCDGSLLNLRSSELMFTNYLTAFNGVSYGFGWIIQDGDQYDMGNIDINKPYYIHGGSTEGFKSMLTIINKGEFIITHLSNIGDQTNEIELTKNIAKILLNK